jgi:hypothetical protein
MKRLTNKEKVEVLKTVKRALFSEIRTSEGINYEHPDGICVYIQNVLTAYRTYEEIQVMFDMHLVKPEGSSHWYWWGFTKEGYLARHRAINTLIKHFESKIKH